MSRLPSEVPGAGGLRDQYGRKEYTYRALNAGLAVDDVQGAGSVFDADGREQVVITSLPASGSALGGIYDITAAPYNATTASADNTAAIQAAINAAKLTGGKVYIPPGIFQYASPLSCDLPSHGFSLSGASGGMGEAATVPSELRYTGTASPAVACHSVFGFGIENIRFTYNNAAFTGDIIDIDGSPHAADCTNWRIVGCSSLHLGAITARSILRINQAINGMVRDCGWAGATTVIRLGEPGGSYVVGIKIENCTFNYGNDCMILFGSGDGENLIVDNCRFEASNNTTGIRGSTVALDGTDNAQYNPVIRDCWFGDASAPTTWIKNLITQSNQYSGMISGCRFATCGVAPGTHLTLRGRWLVQGNSFDGGIVYDSIGGDVLNLVAVGNFYNAPTQLFNSTRFTFGYPQNCYVSLGNSGAEDTMDARIGFKANSGTFGTLGNAPGDLLVGARGNAGYETGDARARVYYGKPTGLSRPMLALQAPTDGVDGFISMVAGTTPTEVMRIGDAKMGFFTASAAPVAQAARAGQLTDSTGGTVTSTLAAGITDAVAKNAIASLAAKVNALETIIHNLGLSA